MTEPSTSSSSGPPLGKHLASSEKKTRDKAVKALAVFLSDESQASMSALDRAKLWKGLFYCFWMSDKPIVQQDLSQELANLILVIPSRDPAIGFIRGFWEATVREWAGIDRYRISKFYMLIRRFVNATFRLLLKHDWDTQTCAEVNEILKGKGGPLCPDDKTVPASLSYHLSDIYLEELDKVLETSDNQSITPLTTLIEPFINIAARTPNKITYERMQTALIGPLLDALAARANAAETHETGSSRKRKRTSESYPNLISSVCTPTPEEKDGVNKEARAVAKEILGDIFEAAGKDDAKDANRRKMYALWKARTEEFDGPPIDRSADGLSDDNPEEPVDALFDERMRLSVPSSISISSAKRCLLVLDLNGTLLHRRRTKSNVNAHVYARPYLGSFLRYISHPAAGLDVAVWSSARRENVQVMVERAWGGAGASKEGELSLPGRARFPDFVFAREDMVLNDRQFRRAFRHGTFNPDHNVRTTKDLRQLWLQLSRMRDEQLRTQNPGPSLALSPPGAFPATEIATSPDTNTVKLSNLHGPQDTILLDDSSHKARLQPHNFLPCPTYGASELRADVNVLTAAAMGDVDEALLAVVGILSEIRNGRAHVDEWNRTGRIWSGPGAQLNPHEMWAQRRKIASPAPSNLVPTTSTSHGSSLSRKLSTSPTLSKPVFEPDPPFMPSSRPTVIGADTAAWFTSPPLVRAWVDYGRGVLAGLGIAAENECVKAWPGWRDGNFEIMGKAKDDIPLVPQEGDKRTKAKNERRAKWEKRKDVKAEVDHGWGKHS
ncbi:ribosomal RNA processing protein 1 [Ceratobasidium sp. AG-Ba]|nr:ribosomal RNA processing protein 1 [Ceratobasidium sp. AG-Ba]QRW09108.1 ribosomal RNA processing protein 1 [Ceratobasidium sp. AG-Ba]